jgi:hypothetical protein
MVRMRAFLACLLWFGICVGGCGSAQSSRTPVFPVCWGRPAPAERGLWVVPRSDVCFLQDESRRSRSSSEKAISLWLVNMTGHRLLVRHDPGNPLRYVDRDHHVVTQSGRRFAVACGVTMWSRLPETYVLLEPLEAGADCRLSPLAIEYHHRSIIPVQYYAGTPTRNARYSDFSMEWSLVYYTVGASEPAQVKVKRSMRIVWED